MKIGRRGQVTIPRELQAKYGFFPGTQVRFVVRGTTLQLVRRDEHRRGVIDRLYAAKAFPKGTDELMKLLR